MNEILQAKLNKHKWDLLGFWKGSLLYLYIEREGQQSKYYLANGIDFELKNNPVINSEESYLDTSEENKLISLLKDKSKDIVFLEDHAKQCHTRIQNIKKYSDNFNLDLLDSEKGNLVRKFKEFQEIYKMNMPFIYTIYFLTDIIEKRVREMLINLSLLPETYSEVLAQLAIPEKVDFVREEEDRLKVIVNQSYDNKEDFLLNLRRHQKKYSWMNIYSFTGNPYQLSYYEQRAQRIKHSDKQENTEPPELSLNNDQKRLVSILKDYTYLRTMRYDIFNYSYNRLISLLNSIAQNIKLKSTDDLVFLSPSEIENSILQGCSVIDLLEINQRKQGFSILLVDGDFHISSGKDNTELQNFFNKFKKKDINSDINQISGQIGFQGLFKGKVKVVLNNSDFLDLGEGDIIVSRMIPLDAIDKVRKSGAIIADLGGVLSHAAVIARELKKPCIIGTKIATQVLKDGDMVEVDADNGVVRVLK